MTQNLSYLLEIGKLSDNRSRLLRIPNTYAEETKMTSRNLIFISEKNFCHVTNKENTCNNPRLNEYIGKKKLDKGIFKEMGKAHWAVARKGLKIEKIVIGQKPICVVELGLLEDGLKTYYDYPPQCNPILEGIKLKGVDSRRKE